MARLFYALWPDPPAQRALAELARSMAEASGGRAVPTEKIHLTLAFLGEVDAGRLAEAEQRIADVAAEPFRLTLDRLGSFRGVRVGWAGASDPPPALCTLAANLTARLRERGFKLEERAFAPHVTLVRRIQRRIEPAAIGAISWNVEAFALVESRAGAYETRKAWMLGAR